MGLLDDLTPPKKVWPCKIRDIAATLEANDAKIFIDAVNDTDWPMSTLSNVLRAKGVDVSEDPIRKHRLKVCSCWKK
jgi:hypothetical protein